MCTVVAAVGRLAGPNAVAGEHLYSLHRSGIALLALSNRTLDMKPGSAAVSV
jgi:hypothetical protein